MLKTMEYRKLFLIVGLIWIVGFLIATLATPDVISSSNVLSSFCKAMECKSWMKDSDFPEVATLYYWVVWTSFPFWVFIWWKWMVNEIGKKNTGILFKKKLFFWQKLVLIIISPLWFYLFYVAVFLYSGEDSRLFDLGTSRIHLALWGMVVPCAAAGLICVGLFSAMRVFMKR